MRAKFVVLANGILTTPKLARIDGMQSFAGDSFHTSRWDYNIDLKGKRVGIIGTGATMVQFVPELAKIVEELYVFQRTPSSIDVRDQRETSVEEFREWAKEPGWAKARRAVCKISQSRTALKANDDYLAGRVNDFRERKQHSEQISPEELVQKQLDSNFRIMEQIRARVDAIVEDPATAAAASPTIPMVVSARPSMTNTCQPLICPMCTSLTQPLRGSVKLMRKALCMTAKSIR